MKTKLQFKTTHNGFSLAEVMLVVVIVGVMASIALPQFSISAEKSKAAEAINILSTLKSAQLVYKYENEIYADEGAGGVDLLEVEIPTPVHFNNPKVYDDATKVATIQRKNLAYTLEIEEDGKINCAPPIAGSRICAQIGYP